MTSQEVNAAIQQSLGLPAKLEPISTVPQEGHVYDFPIWSYSKHRAHVTRIRINYEDGSFHTPSDNVVDSCLQRMRGSFPRNVPGIHDGRSSDQYTLTPIISMRCSFVAKSRESGIF
jgi:hypothetical protein